MTKQMLKKIELLILEIKTLKGLVNSLEANVKGSMYNPSDSDQCAGRIGYCDLADQKGKEAAKAWAKANNDLFQVYRKASRIRNPEARETFFKLDRS